MKGRDWGYEMKAEELFFCCLGKWCDKAGIWKDYSSLYFYHLNMQSLQKFM